jgi:hypothetical protein
LGIFTATIEANGRDSQDTQDAIEVEHRFADALAAKVEAVKEFCVLRDRPMFDATISFPARQQTVSFDVKAVTSLDPHTPNVAAIAVNIHAFAGQTTPDERSIPPIPVLIENERDFEIGARVVLNEWNRMTKLVIVSNNKNKSH